MFRDPFSIKTQFQIVAMSPAFIPFDELPGGKRARAPEPQSAPQLGISHQSSPAYNPALPFGLFSYGGPQFSFSSVKQGNVESNAAYADGAAERCAKRQKVDVTKPVTSQCSSPAPRRPSVTPATGPSPVSSPLSSLLVVTNEPKPRPAKSSRVSRRGPRSWSSWSRAFEAQHRIASLLSTLAPEQPSSPSPSPVLAPLVSPSTPASTRAHQVAHAVRLATLQAKHDRAAAARANSEARQWRAFQRRSPRFVKVDHLPPVERKGWAKAGRKGGVSELLRRAVGWREGEGRRFAEECGRLEGALEGLKRGVVTIGEGQGGW